MLWCDCACLHLAALPLSLVWILSFQVLLICFLRNTYVFYLVATLFNHKLVWNFIRTMDVVLSKEDCIFLLGFSQGICLLDLMLLWKQNLEIQNPLFLFFYIKLMYQDLQTVKTHKLMQKEWSLKTMRQF